MQGGKPDIHAQTIKRGESDTFVGNELAFGGTEWNAGGQPASVRKGPFNARSI